MATGGISLSIAALVVPLLAVESLAQAPPAGGEHVVQRSRTFTLTYQATVRDIPKGAKAIDLWLPWPQTDSNQTIHRVTVDAPHPMAIGRETRFGNQCLHVSAHPEDGFLTVSLTIDATRTENSGSSEPLRDEDRALYLAPEPLVPLSGPVKELALEATRGLTAEKDKARAIYDKVTGMMRYDKSGTGWGRGDAIFACDAKRGNCTDFHALIIGMARSVGIPARFAIGLPLPENHQAGEISGYHCWAELYCMGRGWVPVDSSEAAKSPGKRDYFFGHHDENRLEFSRGRHLILEPAQHGAPVNFFVYPYAEVDGKAYEAIDHKFSFIERARPAAR
jgi:transglutaminase-like putative cysteine protease